MKLELTFGAMVPSLEQQLGYQGIKAKHGLVLHWQRDADAIARLSCRGFLSDGETRQARRRLLKAILRQSSTGAKGK